MSRAAVVLIALLGITLISCASDPSMEVDPATQENNGPAVGSTVTLFPVGLPEDGVQPWEQLDGDGHVLPSERRTSSININTDFTPGVERFLDSGDAADNLEATRLNGTDTTGTSHAMYRISMGSAQPGIVSVDSNLLSGDGYFVGLSNYGTGRWDWHGPFTDNHIRLQAASDGSALLTSPFGNTFVTVLCPAGSSIDVVGIGANQFDPASVTAPAIPLGLSAAPVPGGLELSWSAVLDPDLAGYAIYYSDKSFLNPQSAGVQRVDYLEGSTRHLLSGLQDQTFVALSAIDFGGNESAPTPIASATPLATAPVIVSVSTDRVSGLINDAISLTAAGASNYDWDLDGDGVFEIVADDTGTQSADTSATGIIRPRVQGRNAAGEYVALGGLSLVISGNSRPVASAMASPATGAVPLDVTLTGTGEDAEDSEAQLSYAWDLDADGIYDDGTDNTEIILTYNVPGLYNVKFRVTDTQGAWDVDTLSVLATGVHPDNQLPLADFDIDVWSPYAPFWSFLDASASSDPDGNIVLYEWDFIGDSVFEASGPSPKVQHLFPCRGAFLIQLRVTDNGGAQASQGKFLRLPSAWSQYRGDQTGAGISFFPGAVTNNVRWEILLPGGVRSTAAIAGDGTIYVGCDDGSLYALDSATGAIKWSFTTGGSIQSSPAIAADGTIYFGSVDDFLYAVNPNGTLKWSLGLGGVVTGSPVIAFDESIYIASQGGNLYKIHPAGSVTWAYDTGFGIVSSPSVGIDGTVYVTNLGGFTVAAKPDGSLKWQQDIGTELYSSPARGYDETIYVGSDDNNLHALNPDGSEKWSYTTGGFVDSPASIGVFGGTVYFGSSDDKLYALNLDGSLKWEFPTAGGVLSGPVNDVSGNIYFGSLDGSFRAVDYAGNLLWEYGTNGNVQASPCIGEDGTVYVGSLAGDFIAFGTDLP
ncbi:MAG: PQQ-binding-like beta-propeller repeat protein [Planctomycetales bacterium]|nr:PQQ-binding-like beta-propeller repeat protein [bacterium]UNM08827.1 MAG: PQQ-binding-like beta-propeller repeat protein [Planctomycetales bacterium]